MSLRSIWRRKVGPKDLNCYLKKVDCTQILRNKSFSDQDPITTIRICGCNQIISWRLIAIIIGSDRLMSSWSDYDAAASWSGTDHDFVFWSETDQIVLSLNSVGVKCGPWMLNFIHCRVKPNVILTIESNKIILLIDGSNKIILLTVESNKIIVRLIDVIRIPGHYRLSPFLQQSQLLNYLTLVFRNFTLSNPFANKTK